MGKSLIGVLHGSFSAGGLSGALLASHWHAFSLSTQANFYLPGVAGAVIVLLTFRLMISSAPEKQIHTPTEQNDRTDSTLLKKIARRRLRWLGFLAFTALIIEDAFYDWVAVYMREVVKAPDSWIWYGSAAFSVGLVTGRLSEDWVRDRLAHQYLIAGGWLVASGGLTTVLLVVSPSQVVFGFSSLV